MSNASFEKLYEKALAAAGHHGHVAGQPVLLWQKSKHFQPHIGHGAPDDVTMRVSGIEFTAYAWRGGYMLKHNWSGKVIEMDELPNKNLLGAEAQAELVLRAAERLKVTPARVEGALSKLNEKLTTLTTNKYTVGVPMLDLIEAAKDNGFYISEDDAPIISTTKGREILRIGYPGSKREMTLSFSWHRMDSGRYETVAYAS